MTNLPLFFNGFQCFKTFSVPSGFIKTCFQPDEDSNQVETLTDVEHFQNWIFSLVFAIGTGAPCATSIFGAAWFKPVYYQSYFVIFHQNIFAIEYCHIQYL